jgi:hypothetical protein
MRIGDGVDLEKMAGEGTTDKTLKAASSKTPISRSVSYPLKLSNTAVTGFSTPLAAIFDATSRCIRSENGGSVHTDQPKTDVNASTLMAAITLPVRESRLSPCFLVMALNL